MPDLSRRSFTKMIAGGIVTGAAVSATLTPRNAQSAPQKPNIVYICSDQHSYRVNGFMGHPVVRTPNLDRIAKEGVVFTHAYSGHPVCTPGRASMMTGMYASIVTRSAIPRCGTAVIRCGRCICGSRVTIAALSANSTCATNMTPVLKRSRPRTAINTVPTSPP